MKVTFKCDVHFLFKNLNGEKFVTTCVHCNLKVGLRLVRSKFVFFYFYFHIVLLLSSNQSNPKPYTIKKKSIID
jgi:hypothetical protein